VTKYKSVRTECDGKIFDSKREAGRYQELRILERSGIISGLEIQKPFELRVNGVKICVYRADFAYKDKEGRDIVEDAKGVRTAVYALKCKLMLACHGIRIVET
jgi:hypothetical protein